MHLFVINMAGSRGVQTMKQLKEDLRSKSKKRRREARLRLGIPSHAKFSIDYGHLGWGEADSDILVLLPRGAFEALETVNDFPVRQGKRARKAAKEEEAKQHKLPLESKDLKQSNESGGKTVEVVEPPEPGDPKRNTVPPPPVEPVHVPATVSDAAAAAPLGAITGTPVTPVAVATQTPPDDPTKQPAGEGPVEPPAAPTAEEQAQPPGEGVEG